MTFFDKYLGLIIMFALLVAVIVLYIMYGRPDDNKEDEDFDEVFNEALKESKEKLKTANPVGRYDYTNYGSTSSSSRGNIAKTAIPNQQKQQEESVKIPLFKEKNSSFDEVEKERQNAYDSTPKNSRVIPVKYMPNDENSDLSDDLDMELGSKVQEETQVISKEELKEENLDNDMEKTVILKQGETVVAAANISNRENQVAEDEREEGIRPESPLAFGENICWLAIPEVMASKIIRTLDLYDVEQSNWTKGLNTAYNDNETVFVSPYIYGYILVIGKGLWRKLDLDCDIRKSSWLLNLSSKLGEVLYFSTNSECENHAWAWAKSGKLLRAYGYSGELETHIWNYGSCTEQEENLGFYSFPGFPRSDSSKIPSANDVINLAGEWSVDTTFKEGPFEPKTGFIGKLKF